MTDAERPDCGPSEKTAPSRGEARRQAFLDAAMDVFLEQGFETASVNEIVRRAGGSLATLYQQFGSKEGLFLAVADAAIERFVAPMASAAHEDGPVEQVLRQIGESYLTSMLTPNGLSFFRTVIGEGRKFPPLMQRFLRNGPDRVRTIVAEFLQERAPREGLKINAENAERMASFFCEMVRGRHQYRALADDQYALTPDAVRAHVEAAASVFLDGVRVR